MLKTTELQQYSFVTWILHWISALLVLFLLMTSLGSGLGFTKRLFPNIWMDWHLSVGIALLAVTAIRLKTSKLWSGFYRVRTWYGLGAGFTRSLLLISVSAVLVSGLTIFQKPPLGRAGYLFGLYPMPTLIRLGHSFHNIVIELHISLACLVAGLVIVHALQGSRPFSAIRQSRLASMLWPWRRN